MPLRPPAFPPSNQADWDRWARFTAVVPDDNSVTATKLVDKVVENSKLRDSAPTSVIGRPQSTPGTPDDIAASSDDTFLVRRTGILGFGPLGDSDIPAAIARDAEVTAAITAAVAPLTPLAASTTYDPPSLLDGTGTTTTVSVTGAAMGDFCLASFSLDLQGITVTAYVSAANTVSIRLQNESGGTLDLASGTVRVRVWKQ